MANEEITISELELADEVLADMVLAVDTTTDTRAVTLRQLKAWLGSSLPTGFILPAVGKISDERFTLLDGKTLARTGTYEAFCNKVIEQVRAGNWFSCTEAEFNQDVANFGQCGRFVITNDYVRIPLITRYIGATVTLSEIGRTYAESLPNITGGWYPYSSMGGGGNGALYGSAGNNAAQRGSGGGSNVLFDASRSSSTYQDNAKVNPEHTKFPYYMVVSTEGQQEEIEVDINEVYEDLNLKANTDLSNVNAASSFKEASVGWGMPDYSAGVSKAMGSLHTASVAGLVEFQAHYAKNIIKLYVNDDVIEADAGEFNQLKTLRAFVSAGETYKTEGGDLIVQNSYTPKGLIFYPLKGANNV